MSASISVSGGNLWDQGTWAWCAGGAIRAKVWTSEGHEGRSCSGAAHVTELLLLVAAPASRCYLCPSPPCSWDVQRKLPVQNVLFWSEYAGLDAFLICPEALVLGNQECYQATSD